MPYSRNKWVTKLKFKKKTMCCNLSTYAILPSTHLSKVPQCIFCIRYFLDSKPFILKSLKIRSKNKQA